MGGKNKYTVKWDDTQLSKEYYSYELNNYDDPKLKIGDKVVFKEKRKQKEKLV